MITNPAESLSIAESKNEVFFKKKQKLFRIQSQISFRILFFQPSQAWEEMIFCKIVSQIK